MTTSANPETLPVIYIHHSGGDTEVYADRDVLLVHVDDNMPHDRVFVRVAGRPPRGMIHGPISCTDAGGEAQAARKGRFVSWLIAGAEAALRRKTAKMQ